jgi:hypothetical protein
VSNNVVKRYEFNNRFTVLTDVNGCFRNFDLEFTSSVVRGEKKGEFRFVFGPFFETGAMSYKCDNLGMKHALRRLTSKRMPEVPNYHEHLIENQYRWVNFRNPVLNQWVAWMRKNLRIEVNNVDPAMAIQAWAEAPHPKRKLRMRAMNEIRQRGLMWHFTKVREVAYKCKTGELLEPGKYLRGIGDLTCPGSVVCGYYMDHVKKVFGERYHGSYGYCQFIPTPDVEKLSSVFQGLIQPDELAYYFFSDDACVSVRCRDGIFRCNLDISQCDGSNYDPVFRTLRKAIRVGQHKDYVDGAFAQLRLPCVVRSVDRRQKVRLKPKGSVLYSGSVLTTSVNNMANTLIYLNFAEQCRNRVLLRRDIPELLRASAESVGYIVKIDVAEEIEDLQFLKHSCAVVNGEPIPYVNIGTWLRGYGTYRGVFPCPSSRAMEYARIFNSDVVRSHVHSGNHAIHDAFLTHVVSRSTGMDSEQFKHKKEQGNSTRIPLESLAKRYRVNVVEFEELCGLVRESRVGHVVWHPVIGKIMTKDYGYSPP